MFNRYIILILALLFIAPCSFADDIADVKNFFNSYVNDANSFSTNIPNYYMNNAVIERVVHKKDGTKQAVTFPMSAYKEQMAKSAKIAKMLGYKNNYKNINVIKSGNDFKISALRYPNKDKVGMPFYFIVTKTSNGYKIKKESMDTVVQDFLKHAK